MDGNVERLNSSLGWPHLELIFEVLFESDTHKLAAGGKRGL